MYLSHPVEQCTGQQLSFPNRVSVQQEFQVSQKLTGSRWYIQVFQKKIQCWVSKQAASLFPNAYSLQRHCQVGQADPGAIPELRCELDIRDHHKPKCSCVILQE